MSNWHLSSAATRLQSYHTTMELDPSGSARRSSLHLRRLEHGALAFCPNAGAPLTATTWASLEQFLEMEVSALRALLGGRPIWSQSLSEKLHRLCQSGILPLSRRGVEIDAPAAFLRGSHISLEVKDHLFGSLPSGRMHGKDCSIPFWQIPLLPGTVHGCHCGLSPPWRCSPPSPAELAAQPL